MKTILYKGYHSQRAFDLFCEAQEKGDLMIFLPPLMNRYEFVPFLPESEILIEGDLWQTRPKGLKGESQDYQKKPVAGVFSSGTTNNSRLILYTNENIRSSVKGIFALFENESFENLFCYPQPYHTFGLTLGYGACYFLKKNLIFAEGKYSSEYHKKWLESEPNTITLGTPTHFHDLLAWVEEHGEIPPHTYSCIIGGAQVPMALWQSVRSELQIEKPSIGYGSSEASPGISHLPPGLAPIEDGEIGEILPHVEMSLTDSGIQFSGPNLCHAIIEDEKIEFPSRHVIPDLIEKREADGKLVYRSRLDWILNRGGEKFPIEKLEKQVFEKVGIDILGFGLPDARLGEELGLLIKRRREAPQITMENVYDTLKELTDRDFAQKAIVVDDFPLSQTHKVDRKKARILYLNETKDKKESENEEDS